MISSLLSRNNQNYLSFIMNDDKREILYRYKLLRTERFLLYHQWSRVAWRKKNSIPMFRRNCTCSRKFPKLRWKDLIQIKCVEESMWRRLNAASRSAKKRASQRKALFGNASVADCWPWLQLVTRRGPCVPRKGASSPRLPLSPPPLLIHRLIPPPPFLRFGFPHRPRTRQLGQTANETTVMDIC